MEDGEQSGEYKSLNSGKYSFNFNALPQLHILRILSLFVSDLIQFKSPHFSNDCLKLQQKVEPSCPGTNVPPSDWDACCQRTSNLTRCSCFYFLRFLFQFSCIQTVKIRLFFFCPTSEYPNPNIHITFYNYFSLLLAFILNHLIFHPVPELYCILLVLCFTCATWMGVEEGGVKLL